MLTADVPTVLWPAAWAEHGADAGGRDHVRGQPAPGHGGGGDRQSGLHTTAGGGG